MSYKMRSPTSSMISVDSLAEKGKLGRASLVGEAAEQEGQPKLKLFESPLTHQRKTSSASIPSPRQLDFEISGPIDLAAPAAAAQDDNNNNNNHHRHGSKPNIYDDRDNDSYQKRLEDAQMRETPEFKRYEEATNIELFYDLFFVANLTTFTDSHDINEVAALKAYAGFFCLIWFLWVQVSLFDVRFVQDSILERVGKACQSGVMVGLAIVGTDFNPAKQDQVVFQSIAIILMMSRIVLGFQYLVVMIQVWNYKDTKMPFSLVVSANFGAALIYLGTFFGFTRDGAYSDVFLIWYFTAILETAVNIAVSSQWDVLTFAGTHLVKRMSLLTLIILGEGVIAIAKSIATITKQEEGVTAPLLGTITSAVVIIYFSYMLYFDWLNRSHFGSFREGLWALLHFPFHLALVLLVEGAAQFILWRKVVEVVATVNEKYRVAEAAFTGTSSAELAELLAGVTNQVFDQFSPASRSTAGEAQAAIFAVGNATLNSTDQLRQVSTLFAVVQDSLFDNFGIDPPPPAIPPGTAGEVDPNEEWSKNMGAFMLVFVYFFVAAGFTLIHMNALNLLSRPLRTRGDYSRMVVNFTVGIGLALLASVVNTEGGLIFAQSPWILPSVALAFFSVMALTYTKLLG